MNTLPSAWGRPFTAHELARSIPFEVGRELRGEPALALLRHLLSEILSAQVRQRARRAADEARVNATASALLANVLVAAQNRVDGRRFVAVSFHREQYARTELSASAMSSLRDEMLARGYLEGQTGYRRNASVEGDGHARRTRLRATGRLLQAFADHGVDRRHVGWRYQRNLIVMRAGRPDLEPEPQTIAASRQVLLDAAARVGASQVDLPEDAWDRVVRRYEAERVTDVAAGDERVLSGDLTAFSLYRAFKVDWDRGGRIYGGWWINLPKQERLQLRIQGERVIELDYARLHPTLLFARAGIRLDFDPYEVPGVAGEHARELGKRTFNRLVNKTARRGAPLLSASAEDLAQLPQGLSFKAYLEAFIGRLHPISRWFGTGEGVRLQREDSDLAVEVLATMEAAGAPVLPVHDSFIVRQSDTGLLREAMVAAFEHRYGFKPQIRPA